jgi:hypothetical protein
MFCNQPLERNQIVEHFPVGRRLAFDSNKGRLWVVCRKCERWNLSPIEERWEAIEECEHLFHGIRTRASSENIGLARHKEGTELVRIGTPLRPEFAAWRYGDQFGRRRKKAVLYGVGVGAVVGTVVIAGAVTGVISGALLGQSGNFINLFRNARTLVRLKDENGKVLKLKAPDLDRAKVLSAGEDDDWVIEIKRGSLDKRWEGEAAVKVATRIIPRINRGGAGKAMVQDAVKEIESAGHPIEFLKRMSVEGKGEPGNLWTRSMGDVSWRPIKEKHLGMVQRLPRPTRLALEMALHEEQERRALEGELKTLEAVWQQAEEIAAISDSLLLPEGAEEFVQENRPGRTRESTANQDPPSAS